MKKRIFTALLISLLISISLYADLAEAKQAAQNNYKDFLELCLTSEGAYSRHRLSSDDDYKTATLGEPYPVELITNESISQYEDGDKVSDILTWNNTYLFPVVFNGEMKLMLTVRKYSKEGNYQIGALGNRSLATQLGYHKKNWEKENGARSSYNPTLCLNQDTKCYSIHVPEKDATNLTIIDFSQKAYKEGNTFNALETTISTIKDQLKSVVKRGRY